MKKFLTLVIGLIAACAFWACDSLDAPGIGGINRPGLNDSTLYRPNIEVATPLSDRQKVAKLFLDLTLTQSVVKEVQDAVKKAEYYGIDERLYLAEILAPSKVVESAKPLKLRSQLRTKLASYALSADRNLLNVDTLSKRSYEIYWPYAENWDGQEKPYVTFVPEDEDQEWAYAYFKTATGIDSVYVDEDFAMSHPVWVINQSELPYESIPNFNNNEYELNGRLFYSKAYEMEMQQRADSSLVIEPFGLRPDFEISGEYVYTLKIGKFKSHKQYDSWLAGGSEFVINLGSADSKKITSVESVASSDFVNSVQVNLTRNEIKNKTWKDLNVIMFPNWQHATKDVFFAIKESDPGFKVDFTGKVNVVFGGQTFGVDINFEYTNHDEKIYNTLYDRDFIRAYYDGVPDGEGEILQAGDVFWDFKWKSKRVPSDDQKPHV